MDKNAIIAQIQANPAASKNHADNIFVPMTPEQREARKNAYNNMRKAGLFCIGQRARLM